MTNKKISALTSATTPLAGTETLPIVQSGATVKVAVSDLTAGRTVSASLFSGGQAKLNSSAAYTGTALTVQATNAPADYNLYFEALSAGAGVVPWAISQTNATTTYANTLIFDRGNVTFAGNLVQGTAAKGVNFTANTPAAGMTSQLLNWYEEGTFTLTATPATGTITLNNKTMRYTRIGRMVHIQGYITVTSVSSPTGFVTWGGLPFASPSGSQSWSSVLMADSLSGKTKAYIPASSSTITYSYYNDTNIAQDITSAYSVIISGCYSV
jgi:hypothetical protein